MDKKRLLLLVIFALVSVVLGFLLYVVFFKKPVQPPVDQTGIPTPPEGISDLPSAKEREITQREPESTTLPSTGESTGRGVSTITPRIKAEQIVQNSILSPSVSSNGSVQFYNRQDGRFYKINANGELELLSDQVFYNVQNVTWSPKDSTSIIEYPDGANIYYNFAEKRQVTLPKHWEEFSFDNNGSSVAAKSMGVSEENNWLITSDPEGNNIKLIEPLGKNADKVNVAWSPNKQIIATTRTGDTLGGDREEVLFVGLNDENFRSMVIEGRGFKSSWSPQGDKLLYSVHSARSDFKPELWIVGAEPSSIGSGRRVLNVNTWAEKCSFADDRFVYCGVPESLETGAGIAPSIAENVPDIIYRIDTQTGTKTEVRLERNGHVVEKMFLGDDGKTMYFTDKQRPGLFKVPL